VESGGDGVLARGIVSYLRARPGTSELPWVLERNRDRDAIQLRRPLGKCSQPWSAIEYRTHKGFALEFRWLVWALDLWDGGVMVVQRT
jgi:hypothetical protein